jgi:hypothetical protein
MGPVASGLFVAEGASDEPLANVVESLFRDRGLDLRLTSPPFAQLPKVAKDVKSRVEAGIKLMGNRLDLVVVHRDADNVGSDVRRHEIADALREIDVECCPIVPVKMTEAWLLLCESEIRYVAGNPRGRGLLGLPKAHEVERVADPKTLLRAALLAASASTGRRRERDGKRFNEQRRQLLGRLDRTGPITKLAGWQQLLDDVDYAGAQLRRSQ